MGMGSSASLVAQVVAAVRRSAKITASSMIGFMPPPNSVSWAPPRGTERSSIGGDVAAGGHGSMLDNTLILFGSASSAFHLSRNYPLVLTGGKNMGFKHGQYLDYARDHAFGGSWDGGREPWQREFSREDVPLSNLLLTMLQRLGIEADSFADSTGLITDV